MPIRTAFLINQDLWRDAKRLVRRGTRATRYDDGRMVVSPPGQLLFLDSYPRGRGKRRYVSRSAAPRWRGPAESVPKGSSKSWLTGPHAPAANTRDSGYHGSRCSSQVLDRQWATFQNAAAYVTHGDALPNLTLQRTEAHPQIGPDQEALFGN
jgi:hypothetical protein